MQVKLRLILQLIKLMNLHTVYSLKLGFGCELKKNIVANLLVNSCKLFEKVWVGARVV